MFKHYRIINALRGRDRMAKLVQLTKVLDWEEFLEKINEEKEECIVKKGENQWQ